MHLWRKTLTLALLVLALLIGGEERVSHAGMAAGVTAGDAPTCLLHANKAPVDQKKPSHDCALCQLCDAPAAVPLDTATVVSAWSAPITVVLLRRAAPPPRLRVLSAHRARAPPFLA